MQFFDMPLEQLRTYRPDTAEPEDFEGFWLRTLEQNLPEGDAVLTPVTVDLGHIAGYDVTFRGFDGQPIKG